MLSMMKTIRKPAYLVYRIDYEYDDFELNEHRKLVQYVQSFNDLIPYFQDLVEERHILDVANHPSCRMNSKFKIVPCTISYSKYVSLFKTQML